MNATGGSDSSDSAPETNSTTSAAPTEPADSKPKIGSAVRDGKFEFVVSGIKCGIPTIGSGFLAATAQGEYCRIPVTVTNIGDEPQTMFDSNQYLFDSKGRKFSPSSDAWTADEEGSKLFLEEINPGNSVKGNLYYDVAKGTKPAHVELHDSAFSSGVEVALTK